MNNMYGSPAGPADGPGAAGLPDTNAQYSPPPDRKKRMLRWGTAITLAGFLAGGGIALALSGGLQPGRGDVSGSGGVRGLRGPARPRARR